MPAGDSSPIDCTWRSSGENRQPQCGLLAKLTGLAGAECAVSDDACGQCVKWYPPTAEHLNPVVASLLYALCSKVGAGGLTDGDVDRAESLRRQALAAIPNDFDSVPIADQVDAQPNASLSRIELLIPRPARRFGSPVTQWSVAVTTAPRRQTTLERCLASLAAAGWSQPRIIVDGEVEIPPAWNHLPVTRRIPQIGAWPSYYLTLVELLMRDPAAEAFLIVQDDVVFFEHPGLRRYLESILWPDRRSGIVSLFCSREYASDRPGWYALDQPLIWGAQALVFSREAAIGFLSDPEVVRHRFAEGDLGLARIDLLVGRWAYETDTPVHLCSPSLAQHIGHVSAIWNEPKAFVNRSVAAFAGNCPLPPGVHAPLLDSP